MDQTTQFSGEVRAETDATVLGLDSRLAQRCSGARGLRGQRSAAAP